MKQYIRLLKNRNIALVFWGQVISNFGSSINSLGLSWFILSANGKMSDLGLLLLTAIIPSVVLGPLAGTLADRMNKKKVIVLSDFISGFLSVALVFTSYLPLIYGIVFSQNVIRAFFSPAIRSLYPKLVDKDELATTNALMSISYRVSMLAGPALGGLLISIIGPKGIFLINGISFILSGISELFISYLDESSKCSTNTSVIFDFKEGLEYVRKSPNIKFVIMFFAMLALTGGGWSILTNGFLKLELQASPFVFGMISSMLGVGSLLGAVLIGAIGNKVKPLNSMVTAVIFYAIAHLIMGLNASWIVLGFIFLVCGLFESIINVSYDVYLQQYIEPSMLGRVFSFDIAIGNLVMIFSATITSMLGDLIKPSILLIAYSIFTLCLGIGSLAYQRVNLAMAEPYPCTETECA